MCEIINLPGGGLHLTPPAGPPHGTGSRQGQKERERGARSGRANGSHDAYFTSLTHRPEASRTRCLDLILHEVHGSELCRASHRLLHKPVRGPLVRAHVRHRWSIRTSTWLPPESGMLPRSLVARVEQMRVRMQKWSSTSCDVAPPI